MGLLDLSLVTDTLLNVLSSRINYILTGAPFSVVYSMLPSDKLTGDLTLGLYLYHVVEDPQLKNQPPISADNPPVRFNPMGLQLFYQLTVHTDQIAHAEGNTGEPYMQRVQQAFGLALKTLHDYPRLDKNTVVDDGSLNGNPAFVGGLQNSDSVFRITLLPITAEQAGQYWSSSTEPIRLAAYYQVTVVLLEPEVPKVYAGRVLQYGVQTFVQRAPRLIASHNTVTFKLPTDASDATPRHINIQPAEAAAGETLSFDGIDLSGDVPSQLMIKGPNWDSAVATGIDWSVVAGSDSIGAVVGSDQVSLPSSIIKKSIVPGLYTASVQVTRTPNAATRPLVQTSNAVPFTVAPTVTNISISGSQVSVTGGIFQDADVLPQNVQVIASGVSLPLNTVLSANEGNFVISGPNTINIQLPTPLPPSGNSFPLRIIVNGAECAPRWVKVP